MTANTLLYVNSCTES